MIQINAFLKQEPLGGCMGVGVVIRWLVRRLAYMQLLSQSLFFVCFMCPSPKAVLHSRNHSCSGHYLHNILHSCLKKYIANFSNIRRDIDLITIHQNLTKPKSSKFHQFLDIT